MFNSFKGYASILLAKSSISPNSYVTATNRTYPQCQKSFIENIHSSVPYVAGPDFPHQPVPLALIQNKTNAEVAKSRDMRKKDKTEGVY